MPPFNVVEKALVPAMDLCICLAASYSAMSSPLSVLSKENNPLEIFFTGFFGWGGLGGLWEYKVSALKHRFNFSD